jgi:hypothetical protein
MASTDDMAEAIVSADSWNARVSLVRQIPERFGISEHSDVYALVAERFYAPAVQSEFALVHWRQEYELEPLKSAYERAATETAGFTDVGPDKLATVIAEAPETLRVFRLLVGLLAVEFAAACALVCKERGCPPLKKATIERAERGRITRDTAEVCALTVDRLMNRSLFPRLPTQKNVRLKTDKPDTAEGWKSVRTYAAQGVPLPILLHQRAYGGAFRQLLDATSGSRGELLEEPVAQLFQAEGIPHIRTGTHNQSEVSQRFGLTVRPSPDFVIFDPARDTLCAILECKFANDGGTARDKAARYGSLRAEANRLGGVPLFAMLGGLGWKRTRDALGPVVRDTDGRTFGLATLRGMLETEPFPSLRRSPPSVKPS